ncbi:hypothetical protein B0H21DRAFT_561166 [Amylocystis lapponica]|nr:hypothetical protein B0H21DRAFT_561166 [Amylocystis lapponica]
MACASFRYGARKRESRLYKYPPAASVVSRFSALQQSVCVLCSHITAFTFHFSTHRAIQWRRGRARSPRGPRRRRTPGRLAFKNQKRSSQRGNGCVRSVTPTPLTATLGPSTGTWALIGTGRRLHRQGSSSLHVRQLYARGARGSSAAGVYTLCTGTRTSATHGRLCLRSPRRRCQSRALRGCRPPRPSRGCRAACLLRPSRDRRGVFPPRPSRGRRGASIPRRPSQAHPSARHRRRPRCKTTHGRSSRLSARSHLHPRCARSRWSSRLQSSWPSGCRGQISTSPRPQHRTHSRCRNTTRRVCSLVTSWVTMTGGERDWRSPLPLSTLLVASL